MGMIDAQDLTKRFGDSTAVDAVTFSVNKGEVFGLLGSNGAGKTTTVRMLCCLISKTGGSARIGDLDTSNKTHAFETLGQRASAGKTAQCLNAKTYATVFVSTAGHQSL